MYVLDTNVISEIVKPRMSDNVLDWFHDHDDLFITAITILELHYGIMRLPNGRRKLLLGERIDAIVKDCKDKVLDFDSFSAYLCADLRCKAQSAGITPEIADCMIAAICLRHNAVLVTRNVKDFAYVDGLEIINPFTYESPILAKLKHREAERATAEKGRQGRDNA